MSRLVFAALTLGLLAKGDDRCDNVTTKADCGYVGIGKGECTARSCCWFESSVAGEPWCFYRGVTPPSPQPTPLGPSPTPSPQPAPDPSPWSTGHAMLIYEMDVLHFAGGIDPSSRQSFPVAADQLQRLRDDYGINTIWVMPPYQRFEDAPYASNDFYSIDSRLGSSADAKAFVDKAHALGMKVIFDITTIGHGCDSSRGLDGVKTDDLRLLVNPAKQVLSFPDLCQYLYCSDPQPIIDFYGDVLHHWISTAGVDGFRCDSADLSVFYNGCIQGVDFWRSVISLVRTKHGTKDLYFLAEHTDVNDSEWLKSAGFNSAYASTSGAAFPGAGTELITAIRNGDQASYAALADKLKQLKTLQTTSFSFTNYITNHDIWAYGVPDFSDKPANPLQAFQSAAGLSQALLLITVGSSGTAMMYNGQEFGYTATRQDFNNAAGSSNINFGAATASVEAMHKFIGSRFVEYAKLFRDGDMLFCNKPQSFAIIRTDTETGQRIGAFMGTGCQQDFLDINQSLLTAAVRQYAADAAIDLRISAQLFI